MKPIERILVGVELTRGERVPPGSRRAVREATWLARKIGASLTLLHSTWTDEYFDPLTRNLAIVGEGVAERGRAELKGLVAAAGEQGVAGELVFSEERPVFALVRRVLTGDIGLTVVGKRDEVEAGHLLGSVAMKLLRRCPGPVWAVRPDPDPLHETVLAATDLTEVGGLAVETAAWMAEQHGASLHVLHAYQVAMALQVESGRVPGDVHERHVKELRAQASAAIERELASTTFASRPEGGRAHVHLVHDSPAHAIGEAVERLRPDVLVMGTISRRGLPGLVVGNTAEKLLPRVDCSILAVKPPDFEPPPLD